MSVETLPPAGPVTATSVARVVIADDQTLFRAGLAHLLNLDPRIKVVGQAADGVEALKLAQSLKPDVVLLDLKMPNMDGVEATRRIVAEVPDTRVLILTSFDMDTYVIDALRAGASGYVLKNSQPSAIAAGLVAVMAGERVMATAVANRVLEMLTGSTTPKEFYDGLTAREIEVLKLIAAGKPNKHISMKLHISDKTVRNHISNMYQKLGIYDRSQAVLYAVRKGLIDL